MQIKKLAYLKITSSDDKFCEIYTFLKPTILYLPYDLILNIKKIEKCKICFIITSTSNPTMNEKIILSLCGTESKKVKINYKGSEIVICFKLCEISILKPCCPQPHNCCFEQDDCFQEEDCFDKTDNCFSDLNDC